MRTFRIIAVNAKVLASRLQKSEGGRKAFAASATNVPLLPLAVQKPAETNP